MVQADSEEHYLAIRMPLRDFAGCSNQLRCPERFQHGCTRIADGAKLNDVACPDLIVVFS